MLMWCGMDLNLVWELTSGIRIRMSADYEATHAHQLSCERTSVDMIAG